MIRLAAALLILSTALGTRGQPINLPVNPRIRVRVIGEDVLNGRPFGNELSSTVYVDEIASEQKGQLARVRQFIREDQWSEAADMLVRLAESDLRKLAEIESANTSATPFARQAKHLVPLSDVLHQIVHRLAQQAPETLIEYRQRVDPLAKRWLESARKNRDPRQLEQLIEEAFHSSHGDEALITLGDWALERGDFHEARIHYHKIHGVLQWQVARQPFPIWVRPTRGEVASVLANELLEPEGTASHGTGLAFIDSPIPRADVWARLVLVSMLQGNVNRASSELAILKKAWPEATGTIGGQQGKLGVLLSKLLTMSNAWPTSEQRDWPTFGGNFARNTNSNIAIDIPMKSTWTKELEPIDEDEQLDQRSIRKRFGLPTESNGEAPDKPCSYFPIVFEKKIVFKDHSQIYCLELETGDPAWSNRDDGRFYSLSNTIVAPSVPFGDQLSTLGQHRHTLCYANGLITATMGSSQSGNPTNSTLIGFDIDSQGAIQFGPIPVENSRWTYHGAPIHDANRCWIGLRLRDASAQDFLACFDIHSGKQLWRTRICTAETLGGNAIESSCNFLLSKHESTVFVSSHLGTIAAVSAQTGNILWVMQYPRRGPTVQNLTDQSWHAVRDLTPCLVHDDLVIAAPSDTDHVFALRRSTGELIWSTPLATDATKILGVSKSGQLIMSGRRLWWLDAYTGRPSAQVDVNPFPASSTAEPTGSGRGLLSAENVYWPVIEDGESKIYVLRQSDGKPNRKPIDLQERGVDAGNLLVVPGYLLIAGPETIAAFRLD